MVNKDLFPHLKNIKPLLVLSLVSATIIIFGTTIVPLQALYAQNATANITSTDQISNSVIATLAKPGFGGKYDLLINGKPTPISYNIIGGALVGMLADPSRHSINVAVNPGPRGGALEIQLPRQIVDAKNAAGNDMPYVVVMDGSRISGEASGICVGISVTGQPCSNIQGTYKETGNTGTDRVLTVLFSEDNRFLEIHGTTGMG